MLDLPHAKIVKRDVRNFMVPVRVVLMYELKWTPQRSSRG